MRRRAAALAVLLGVTAAHLWLAARLADLRLGAGAADRSPARIEVAFVRQLTPTAPPTLAPAPPRRPRAPRAPTAVDAAAAPASAASAPEAPPPQTVDIAGWGAPVESEPEPGPLAAAPGSTPTAPAPTPAQAPSVTPPPAAEAAASAPTFDWPPSTRLRYALTGYYRGPVEGSAKVEWLRQGSRYQVHLDIIIGAPFAPLITRQMSSDGELGPAGLRPRRYDERTRLLWQDPYARRIDFGPRTVRLSGGRQVPRPEGVQDPVSQFVQLTWRFTQQPALLATGQTVELPLAVSREVSTWVYDVGMAETLYTPAGPVDAVHLRPRRKPQRGGELVPEMWFAPTLQYLPVRILIRQDEETFVDLLVDRLPEQAVAEPVPALGRIGAPLEETPR